MRYIVAVALVLSVMLSGCQFSLWDGGFVQKTDCSKFKVGSVSSDFLFLNAEQNRVDKQIVEEDLKSNGSMLGVFYERRF